MCTCIFYSEKHHFIALAHAGWRGTYGQIVVEMLKYVEFDYQDLNVVIGPATSSTYEINDDIKNKFETLPINSDKYIETRDTDRHGIDLKLANALLLKIVAYQLKILILQNTLPQKTYRFFLLSC